MEEYINFKIKIKGKLCNFNTLTAHLTNVKITFESFINNLERNLDLTIVNNPFLTVVLGSFNAKLGLWYNNDITTYKGSKIDGVNSQFRLQHKIKEPAHIIGDSSLFQT